MPTPNLGYIYLITNRFNGKKYVGQTRFSLSTRWRQHVDAAGDGSTFAIHRAIRKYGPESFSIKEIAKCAPENLNDIESLCIEIFDSFCFTGHGYNMTKGGGGISGWRMPPVTEEWRRKQKESHSGKVFSEEHLKNLRLAHIGRVYHKRGKSSHPSKLRGRKLSEQTRQKMSQAHRGKSSGPHSEETKRKISESRRRFLTTCGNIHPAKPECSENAGR